MAEKLIQQLIQNQQLMGKSRIDDSIKNANNRILSFSRNLIGLLDLDEEIKKGNLTPITCKDMKYSIKAFLDNKTGLVYRFKYNDNSGGIFLGRKELYESLISRMVQRFANSVIYYPAEIDGKRGVLSLDWSNGGVNLNCLDGLYDVESLAEINYYQGISQNFTKKAFSDLKTIPQHFMAGNCDFVPRNIVYKKSGAKASDLLFYDYGYSTFARVESFLEKMSLEPNKSNILFAYREGVWGAINCTVGMGATKNLMQYSDLEDLQEDFIVYASKNTEFRNNIKKALQLSEQEFMEAIRQLRHEGFKVYPDNEKIVRQVTQTNAKIYEKCL